MVAKDIDVLGIGNAIVDVIAQAGDDFLVREGIAKGGMTLIDADRAESLYGRMGPGIECSGGSVANSIAGIAALGGRAAYIGKVRDDGLGKVFGHDIRSLGVEFATPPATDGLPTARCLILVTPDAQRSMNTFLGACAALGPDDVDPGLIARSKITYLEGYLWDPPAAKEAFLKAMTLTHTAGGEVALSLSDAFCVHRYREEFLDLVENRVDILFANESEIKALYQVDHFDAALQLARGHTRVAALTRSEKGSVVVAGDEMHVIDAMPQGAVVDSTGAGDLYAAGFLYGLTQGRSLYDCGRLGSLCAGEVISHVGARPETDLRALAAKYGL